MTTLTRLRRVRLTRQYRPHPGHPYEVATVLAVVFTPLADCPHCAGTGEVIRHGCDPDNPDPWGEPCDCTYPRRDLAVRIPGVTAVTDVDPGEPPF
jgi:hypothetical protein